MLRPHHLQLRIGSVLAHSSHTMILPIENVVAVHRWRHPTHNHPPSQRVHRSDTRTRSAWFPPSSMRVRNVDICGAPNTWHSTKHQHVQSLVQDTQFRGFFSPQSRAPRDARTSDIEAMTMPESAKSRQRRECRSRRRPHKTPRKLLERTPLSSTQHW